MTEQEGMTVTHSQSLSLSLSNRGGGERGEATGHVGAAEGRVGRREEGSRDDLGRALQNGASLGRGQETSLRGRTDSHQPAGGLQRSEYRSVSALAWKSMDWILFFYFLV